MLRRRCSTSLLQQAQRRFGGGPAKAYDHTASFSRSLTAEETSLLAQQKNRTVASMIPGKVFMRHWLAGEQATVSIFNRAISLGVTGGLLYWATFHFNSGNSSYSAAHMSLYVLAATFLVLHTHKLWLYGAFLMPYLAVLIR